MSTPDAFPPQMRTTPRVDHMRPAGRPDELHPAARPLILSPDCRAGKCKACTEAAWDEAEDGPTPCQCRCH